jgi:hypothetical protein
LSPALQPGNNDVTSNEDREIWVGTGGESFFGNSSSNGFNEVYDTAGGVLVEYPSGKALEAAYQWWGSSGGPQAGAIVGPVDYCPYLTCDPDVDPNCLPGCQGSFGGEQPGTVRERDVEGGSAFAGITERTFVERLRARIRDVRARLEAGSSSPDAAAQVRELGSLHRLDRADSTGEATATDALLAQIRARLAEVQLPAGVRDAGEAAIEVGSLLALSRRDYATAASLLEQYGSLVVGEQSTRQLTMVRAYVLARDGYRSEASALISALAASSTPIEARELTNLAAMMERRSGDGAPGGFAAHVLVNPASLEAATAVDALRVIPNPARSRASVDVLLDAPTRVKIAVYDVLGREVADLVAGALPAGRSSFDLDTGSLAAGSHLVRAILESSDGRRRTLVERLAIVRP